MKALAHRTVPRHRARHNRSLATKAASTNPALGWLTFAGLLCFFLNSVVSAERQPSAEQEWHRYDVAGTTAYHKGDFQQAEIELIRACEVAERFEKPDPRLIRSLNSLAIVYAAQAKHHKAELLLERVVDISQQRSGPNQPDTVPYLFNLAMVHRKAGNVEEAEAVCLKAVAIVETVRGTDHADYAVCLNNLAHLRWQQGQLDEAASLLKRSLEISENALGPNHRQVGICLNNLAGLYRTQGKYKQAQTMLERALAVFENSSGAEHAEVAMALNSLASVYSHQNQYAEAEPLLMRSVSILENTLGRQHPEVASGLVNLAVLYERQGRTKEAASLFRRAYGVFSVTLGSKHPYAAECRSHLDRLSGKQDSDETREGAHGPRVIAGFSIPQAGRPILVPVRIGQEDILFLLDTGSEITAFDRSLQNRLQPTSNSVELAAAIKPFTQRLFRTPEASIGELPLLNGGHVICLDLSEFRRISGEEIKGILGMDFLEWHVIRIDFDRGKLSFLTAVEPDSGTLVPITFKATRLPSAPVSLGGGTLERFVLDTGADGSGSIEANLFEKLQQREELVLDGDTLQATISGTTKRRGGRVSSINLIGFQHESLLFDEGHNSLLGRGYLSRFLVTIDFPNRIMYLRKGERYGDPDRCDLSGIHLIQTDGRIVVHSVDPGSSAAVAGIEPADVVVAIDGVTSQSIDLFKLRRLLTAPKRRVRLKIARGNSEFNIVVDLPAKARHTASDG